MAYDEPAAAPRPGAAPGPWIDLLAGGGLAAFRAPDRRWLRCAEVALDPADPRRLAAAPGAGELLVNGPGKVADLITAESFGDLELECGFLLAKGSNSGIKMHGHYEVQLFDSFGRTALSGSDCGGLYPRAELKPKYRHLDRGTAPRVNACKRPGEWQRLRIVFRAPRFGADGAKLAPARYDLVELNGVAVQVNAVQATPTGHKWRDREHASAPLLLQGDHGPVAFRGLRVRRLPPSA